MPPVSGQKAAGQTPQQHLYTQKSPADVVLTAHFNEKGRQSTKSVGHPWRYFVADGESLEKIEQFIKDSRNVETIYQDFADSVGAKAYNGRSFEFDFDMKDLEQIEGQSNMRFRKDPDFTTPCMSMGDFYPDRETERGREIGEKAQQLQALLYPERRFAAWLGALNVDTNEHGHPRFGDRDRKSAEIEKIGDLWIIKAPVVGKGVYGADGKGSMLSGFEDSWTVPPDAMPIKISDYFKLLEDANALSQMPNTKKPPQQPKI